MTPHYVLSHRRGRTLHAYYCSTESDYHQLFACFNNLAVSKERRACMMPVDVETQGGKKYSERGRPTEKKSTAVYIIPRLPFMSGGLLSCWTGLQLPQSGSVQWCHDCQCVSNCSIYPIRLMRRWSKKVLSVLLLQYRVRVYAGVSASET